MKILVSVHNIVHIRYLGEGIQAMAARGHDVQLLIEGTSKANTTDRALKACLASSDRIKLVPAHNMRGVGWLRKRTLRDLIAYALYFDPSHPSPDLSERYITYLPPQLRGPLAKPRIRKILTSKPMVRVYKAIARRLPHEKEVIEALQNDRPDMVFASPFIMEKSMQVELIRAAQSLGIPTVVAVLSWDNLTTKGTFHAVPDGLLVWNRALLKEARELHGIPENRIVVTGSPTFDFWFDKVASVDREKFCETIGADPTKHLVTYLGSSAGIAADESKYLSELAAILAAHPLGQQIHLVIRPHPVNADTWEGFSRPNAVVWPRGGTWPDSEETKQDYYNTLYHSKAVIGVNTSAFLDAAVLDKPCITALTSHYKHTQSGRGHFQHLIDADFLEVAHSFEQVAEVLGDIIEGNDSKTANRKRFVENFLRPNGLDKTVSPLFALAVEMMGKGHSAAETNAALAAAP